MTCYISTCLASSARPLAEATFWTISLSPPVAAHERGLGGGVRSCSSSDPSPIVPTGSLANRLKGCAGTCPSSCGGRIGVYRAAREKGEPEKEGQRAVVTAGVNGEWWANERLLPRALILQELRDHMQARRASESCVSSKIFSSACSWADDIIMLKYMARTQNIVKRLLPPTFSREASRLHDARTKSCIARKYAAPGEST